MASLNYYVTPIHTQRQRRAIELQRQRNAEEKAAWEATLPAPPEDDGSIDTPEHVLDAYVEPDLPPIEVELTTHWHGFKPGDRVRLNGGALGMRTARPGDTGTVVGHRLLGLVDVRLDRDAKDISPLLVWWDCLDRIEVAA